jgi:uncharacterized protein YbjT (DUF2867 family)
MGLRAIIIGATGLVGSEMLQAILGDERFSQAIIFVRRPTNIQDPKLKEFVIDFSKLNEWRGNIQGDILFSALGTTLAQAGSREAQRVVDYDYQLQVAQSAKVNGVKNYVLISAPYADPKSSLAYTRIKGELERDIKKLSFPKTTILRPGLLQGNREQKRFVEEKAAILLNTLPQIPGLEGLRPMSGKLVAHVSIEAALNDYVGTQILKPKDIFHYLKL